MNKVKTNKQVKVPAQYKKTDLVTDKIIAELRIVVLNLVAKSEENLALIKELNKQIKNEKRSMAKRKK